MIRVVKRDGRVEKLDIRKIQKYTADAVAGLKDVSQSELEVDAKLQFRDMISSKDIQETMIKTAVDKIDVDRPDWTFVASRLFLYDLYHKVNRFTGYTHLRDYFIRGEKEGKIILGLKDKYDLDELNSYIKPERDLQFTYLGIKTLYDRYLLKDNIGNPIELPQHLFMALAMFLAQNEKDRDYWAKKFYDILSKFEVMAATPTLSNGRTPRHQLSSCFRKGTKVRTIQGYKDIDKIDIGDIVLTHKNRFKRVYELFVRDYAKNIIKLNINGLIKDLEATAEHPILSLKKDDIKCIRKLSHCIVSQGKSKRCFSLKGEYKNDCELLDKKYSSKWNKIEDLKKGDFVSISYPKYIGKDTIYISDYVKTKNIVVYKDKIMFKRSSSSFYSCERSFFNNQILAVNDKIELNSDFMLLLGYFLAEGHISKDLNQITFTFGSKEISYIEETKILIEKIFDIEPIIKENRDNSTNIMVHSKIIALFFLELVGTGFNKKILNSDIVFANPDVQKSLLIGVIRGDGCALEEGYQLTMSNEKLIEQLFEIALRCGLSPYMKRDAKKHKYATVKASHLKISSREDREFVLSVGKNIQNIKFNQTKKSTLRYFWFEDEYFMKIIDREESYIEEKVYNIEVEDDHSYSVAGVNVHNCYIGSTGDNIEGIFDGYKEMALLSKFGGGIGWDWSKVRGMGSDIDGHKHAAGGIIPFLKITNDVAIAVDQLGTRKGAIAVYIEPWHIDIKDFLDLKKNSGEERRRAHDLFPALWLNDIFMERVQEDGDWTLFDPFEVSELTDLYGDEFTERYIELEKRDDITKDIISAKGLWKDILRSYFETGNPFLTFKDTANRRNPNSHSGIIRSSNLCVTGDTRLHTQFGLVKAKDLAENYSEILATYDHRTDGDISNLGVSTAKSLKMFKTKENADIYEVVTKDGYKIKSTLWHEYYVSDHNKKIIEKRSLKDISVGDYLLIQSGEGQFGTEGNYDLGFLMGIVTGDGTFSYKESKKHSIVHIDLYNEDMNLGHMIYKQIENTIKKYYSLLPYPYKKNFKNGYPKIIQHTKNSKKLRFSNIRLGRIFDEQFNFNGKTKYQVPEVIFKGTKESIKGYLQGLFIADGTINKLENNGIPTFSIQLASIKKSLLEEIQILLSNFGIRSKISKTVDGRKAVFSYITVGGEQRLYNSKPFYRLNINGNNAIKFIDNIGFIGQKQIKALDILSKRKELGYSRESRKNEKFLVEIKDIKYIGKEDVYDTTQLYNHSLIFNGLVTSNCTEIFQNTSPNHYKIKLVFNDGSINTFEEDDIVTLDSGISKPAKKITALDKLNGKQIWIVEKETIDGDTAVCNLASVNLSKINSREDIERVVPIAIRMLDNVIDLNFYPLAKVKKTNESTRAIGLGVMGEAQMLAENQIRWGSDRHLYKIDEIMESISYYAIKTSSDLAKEKGKYPKFEGSNWSRGICPIDNANRYASELVNREMSHNWSELREKIKRDGMRNGYLMAIAPTSSISILTGTTQAIEPVYKRKWFEENLSGLIPIVVPNLSPDTWEYYTPSYELNQNILIKAGAIRQKWIDQGQSLNIFITLDKASGRYLNEIYMNAWMYGLKSTYYLRSQSPETTNDIEDRSSECIGCQ